MCLWLCFEPFFIVQLFNCAAVGAVCKIAVYDHACRGYG